MNKILIKDNHMNLETHKKLKFQLLMPSIKIICFSMMIFSAISFFVFLFFLGFEDAIPMAIFFIMFALILIIRANNCVKRLYAMQIERFQMEDVEYDLEFDEHQINTITFQGTTITKYKDIKKIYIKNGYVLLVTKAGFITFFERKNISDDEYVRIKELINVNNTSN